MATQILLNSLRAYEAARQRLVEAREAEFAPSRAVRVMNTRYDGHGLIVRDEACPPDQVAVRLENGNTWWYPAADCSVAQRDACPQWLKDAMRLESKSVVRRLMAQKADHL